MGEVKAKRAPAKKKTSPPKAPSECTGSDAPAAAADQRKAATKVSVGALRGALKDVLGAIHSNVTIPILSHVLIDASEHQLVLTGTDLDMWVRRTLASEPEENWKGFAVTVPAKPLADLLAQLDADAVVTIEAPTGAESRAAIHCGRSRFFLVCLPPEDLPMPSQMGEYAGFDINCSALDDALASIVQAISHDETRYYLNGVLVHRPEGADQLRMAATDGHRLARAALPLPNGAETWPDTLWPRRAVTVLQKLLAAGAKTGTAEDPAQALVQVASEKAGALLRFAMPAADCGEVELTTKTIDGTFPDYERVVPTEPPRSAIIDRAALSTAVRRVAVFAAKESRAVRAGFTSDKLVLTVRSPELGEAREEMPCLLTWTDAGEGGDPALEVGFNADYWLQTLGAMASDELSMRLGGDAGAPVLVTEPGAEADCRLLQVLMPMQV